MKNFNVIQQQRIHFYFSRPNSKFYFAQNQMKYNYFTPSIEIIIVEIQLPLL